MTDQLRYVAPLPGTAKQSDSKFRRIMRRVPLSFAVVVGVPTLVAAVYWGVVATPRYVAESHFTVRKTDTPRANNLGIVLQNVGLTAGGPESFVVQEFIASRDAAQYLDTKFDFDKVYGRPGVDMFSRYPGIWADDTDEGRFKALKRFINVGYNGSTGITTLKVEAFTAEDAQKINLELLSAAEGLVNRLNERAAADAVAEAQKAVEEATQRRANIQARLTEFRNRERILDPEMAAAESSQLIASLLGTAAGIRAEISEIESSAPQSPQLSILRGRLASYEAQIAEARAKMVGQSQSLAPKVSTYEGLMLERELADRSLSEAAAGLISSQQDARRQKLYLDRIVEPNKADKATEPRRLRAILLVFLTSLMVYFLGRLLVAGLREHRQE